MKMTDEQQKEYEAIVEQLIKFMAENFNPHQKVIVDSESAELVSGEHVFRTTKYIMD
jgi:hypothetical protein